MDERQKAIRTVKTIAALFAGYAEEAEGFASEMEQAIRDHDRDMVFANFLTLTGLLATGIQHLKLVYADEVVQRNLAREEFIGALRPLAITMRVCADSITRFIRPDRAVGFLLYSKEGWPYDESFNNAWYWVDDDSYKPVAGLANKILELTQRGAYKEVVRLAVAGQYYDATLFDPSASFFDPKEQAEANAIFSALGRFCDVAIAPARTSLNGVI